MVHIYTILHIGFLSTHRNLIRGANSELDTFLMAKVVFLSVEVSSNFSACFSDLFKLLLLLFRSK
jgi:hypothetical protein